ATRSGATHVHPLAVSQTDTDRLADAIALQRRTARQVREDLKATQSGPATNMLLALARAGAGVAGLLDDPANIPAAKPAVVKLVGDGEIDRAGQKAAAEIGRLDEKRRRRQTAREFFTSTGTEDGSPQGPGRAKQSPRRPGYLDLLAQESNREPDLDTA
ncbi:MAG TPA: hypothetical protein VMY35_05970, partial [Phycisphaerae bacterium]|nr:hypothetical protein [Phycisphaerae bacterium]